MTLACIAASGATFYVLVITARAEPVGALGLLGWWPLVPTDVIRCCCLTFLLYAGPLFEQVVIERVFDDFRGGRAVVETLSSWVGYRNYVAGPITEEVIFRSAMIPLHLLAKVSPSNIVFVTPLYFGIAHIHHFYEFTLTHPHTSFLPALLRSVFQFTYTSVFGWYATFIYLRTGSIYACIIIHAFCNCVGLPRFWGRLKRREIYGAAPVVIRGKDDGDRVQARGRGDTLSVGWTVIYYVLLVLGAWAFKLALWPLTASPHALATFDSSS